MLTGSKQLLNNAQKSGYAIGHFNTSDLEITKAIVMAAAKLNSPVIVATSEKAISFAGLEQLADIIKNEAEQVKIPVVMHLDHAKSFDLCQKAIQTGYTSVMIDASSLSFEENISLTSRVVKLAHRENVTVEAELGALATPDKYQVGINQFLTDPEKAEEFVKTTEIDGLAIAIGNAHGIPLPEEKLDFNRLSQIRDKVSVPLVLHGASSTPEAEMKKAISLGICKINIDTDIKIAFSKNIVEFLKTHQQNIDPREMLGSAASAVEAVVEKKIELIGSRDKAVS